MTSFGSSGRFGGSVPPPKGIPGRSLNSSEIRQVRSKLRAAAYSSRGVDWHRLFKHYDRTNSGELNVKQFKRALRADAKISVSMLPDNHVRHLFNTIDLDGGGTIDIKEFVSWVEGADSSEEAIGYSGQERRSSGYGRRSPTELSSPSQRRFHFGEGRWLNNNDENSRAEGVDFRNNSHLEQEQDDVSSVTNAMFNAQLALAEENSPFSLKSVAANRKNMLKKKTKKNDQEMNTSVEADFIRMQLQQEENERIIESQAGQLAVLKMIVEKQYDALSPRSKQTTKQKEIMPVSQKNVNELIVPKKIATFTVRCHCGAMQGEFYTPKPQIICWDCNCSDCEMRRNLHFVIPAASFKPTCDVEKVTTLYCWGTGVAQRRFCKSCGILPWYTPRSNPNGVGITLGCVDWGVGERPGIVIKRYDGRNWEESHKSTGIAAESEIPEESGDEDILL